MPPDQGRGKSGPADAEFFSGRGRTVAATGTFDSTAIRDTLVG
jgi:hypothetical protein